MPGERRRVFTGAAGIQLHDALVREAQAGLEEVQRRRGRRADLEHRADRRRTLGDQEGVPLAPVHGAALIGQPAAGFTGLFLRGAGVRIDRREDEVVGSRHAEHAADRAHDAHDGLALSRRLQVLERAPSAACIVEEPRMVELAVFVDVGIAIDRIERKSAPHQPLNHGVRVDRVGGAHQIHRRLYALLRDAGFSVRRVHRLAERQVDDVAERVACVEGLLFCLRSFNGPADHAFQLLDLIGQGLGRGRAQRELPAFEALANPEIQVTFSVRRSPRRARCNRPDRR